MTRPPLTPTRPLTSIAEFLAAHRALLNDYLSAVSAADPEADTDASASAPAVS